MNAEITITQRAFLELYHSKRDYLASKPRQFITDLLHTAEELRHAEDFSMRASAEINCAACTSILEQLNKK